MQIDRHALVRESFSGRVWGQRPGQPLSFFGLIGEVGFVVGEVAIAIIGSTGSGKTALATRLARRFTSFEPVSVDAMAVYRHLDIGTAKPTPEERNELTWHLVDVADPEEEFSVARFQGLARTAIADISSRKRRVMLVGGTGLYHRAIIDELKIPGRYPDIAQTLFAKAETEDGLARLYEELVAVDPLGASRILASNARRIVRALEVSLGSGRPFSSYGPGLSTYGPCPYLLVGLSVERDVLYERLEARLDAQLAAGFLEEVRGLLARKAGLSRTARQALGYRELIAHLEGETTLEEARTEILKQTRNFARRQLAWFRRDPRIHWVDATHPELDELVCALMDNELVAPR